MIVTFKKEYRCENCGNLSMVPAECCGAQMIESEREDLDEEYYFTYEDRLIRK